jgi:hypothetical protein
MQAEAARTFASLLSPTVSTDSTDSTDFNPVEGPVEVSDREKALARSAS